MLETFILFEVDKAIYAVRSDQVDFLEMFEATTRVPNAPDFVEGVTAVRGQVIPVVSMRRRFNIKNAPLTPRSRIVVIRVDGRQIGMLVDSSREFLRVSSEHIQPVPGGLSGPGIEYLQGVIALPGRVILVISLQRLFNNDERSELTSQPAARS